MVIQEQSPQGSGGVREVTFSQRVLDGKGEIAKWNFTVENPNKHDFSKMIKVKNQE